MLRYEVSGTRAVLTIDDPGRRNALSIEALDALADALREAAADDAVRVVVVTGAGDRAFSAGADLGSLRTLETGTDQRPGRRYIEVLRSLRAMPKPSIARVNGDAFGGGFGLAATCDVVVAADDARFGTPEIRVGLWPMMITAVLQPLVSQKRLFELMATGRLISAEEAAEMGAVTRVVPRNALDETVDDVVELLCAASPSTLAMGKQAFFAAAGMATDAALDYLEERFAALLETDDAREGIAAFTEKRRPLWTGR